MLKISSNTSRILKITNRESIRQMLCLLIVILKVEILKKFIRIKTLKHIIFLWTWIQTPEDINNGFTLELETFKKTQIINLLFGISLNLNLFIRTE
jgi:uncharacterized membrane protein YqhA